MNVCDNQEKQYDVQSKADREWSTLPTLELEFQQL